MTTDEFRSLTFHRNRRIEDLMQKYAKSLVTWCVENRIDTIVLGENTYWKRSSNIGRTNNQNFVQLPFDSLKCRIRYLAMWNGIRCVDQEESYTSKASFLDEDPIPVYREAIPEEVAFSGKRSPSSYAGQSKKGGFRGLYVCRNGTVINSDLNGSANILRKAFPYAFDEMPVPDFTKVEVIVHPDRELVLANRGKQMSGKKVISHAKRKRLNRKAS